VFPSSIGPLELVVVLIIALIVIGPKKLPEVGRSVGKGLREFKGALSAESRDESDWNDDGWDEHRQSEESDAGTHDDGAEDTSRERQAQA